MKLKPVKPSTDKELVALAKLNAAALSAAILATAVERAIVSATTLQMFGIGYSAEFGRYTFPMRDGGQKICGFALWGGIKDGVWNERPGLIPGAKCMGLFIPQPYEVSECPLVDAPQTLILPQGPIAAAAVRDMGFMGVIGRPTDFAAAGEVTRLLAGHPPQEAIVALPCGEGLPGYAAGAAGALDMMEALMGMRQVASVRCLNVPAGRMFREVAYDFASMAAMIIVAKVMNKTRIEAGRRKLAMLEKGRAA